MREGRGETRIHESLTTHSLFLSNIHSSLPVMGHPPQSVIPMRPPPLGAIIGRPQPKERTPHQSSLSESRLTHSKNHPKGKKKKKKRESRHCRSILLSPAGYNHLDFVPVKKKPRLTAIACTKILSFHLISLCPLTGEMILLDRIAPQNYADECACPLSCL